MVTRRVSGLAGAALLAATALPGAARAAGGGSQLPQMNFANPLTLTQVIWMLVIMAVLYVALAFWGLPRIGAAIDARAARIRGDLDAARQGRQDADRAIDDLDAAMRDARERSDRTVAAAIDSARARAAAQRAEADARLAARLARAETEIADARAEAMSMLTPIATDVSAALVERISGRAPHPDSLARALGQARSAA